MRLERERKVLVAEDDAAIRQLLGRLLRSVGAGEIVEVGDGLSACECFEAAPADYELVVLDLSMPVMTGVEALAAIREVRPDIRVIMLTGHAIDGAIRSVLEGFGVSVLVKPFGLREFVDLVGRGGATAR